MSNASLSFEDGGPPPELTENSLWDWLVKDLDLQAPAIASLHQAAEHLAYLWKDADAQPSFTDKDAHLQWSYAQLKTAAMRVAAFLSSQITQKRKSGGKQDVIVTFVYNSIEWAVLFWAAIALGLPYSPLDPSFLDQPEQFRYYMECLNPSIILVEDAAAAEKVNDLGTDAYIKITCDSESSKDVSGWHHFDNLFWGTAAAMSHPSNLQASVQNVSFIESSTRDESLDTLPADTAVVLFSSGTSGKPKGCPHTAKSFAMQVEGYMSMRPCQWNPSTRDILVSLVFRPICYLGCFNTWKCGGAVVFPAPKFDPSITIDAIKSHKGTHLKLVPPQAQALLDNEKAGPSTLKFTSIGGNIIASDLLENFQKTFTVDRVLSIWGMTEGAGVVGWKSGDEDIPTNPHGLSAIGRVLPGVKVRISDPQSEKPTAVARGDIGELHISSPANIQRYLFNRNADEFYTDDEGSWFITGDHAKMDESGIIYVVGRSKDSINRNGGIVVPGNIEACLDQFPGVKSQVVGIPDSEQGEVPVAILKEWPKGDEQVTKESLEKAVVRDIGEEASLSDVITLEDLQMTDWPYNTTAKILKKDLTDAIIRLKEGSKE